MQHGVSHRRGRCPSCQHVFVFAPQRPPRLCPLCGSPPRRLKPTVPPDDLRTKSPEALRSMSRLELGQASDLEISGMSPAQYEAYKERLRQLARRDALLWTISAGAIAAILFILLPSLF